jgi:hypothetical protein
MYFSALPCYPVPLSPKYCPQHPTPKHPQSVINQISKYRRHCSTRHPRRSNALIHTRHPSEGRTGKVWCPPNKPSCFLPSNQSVSPITIACSSPPLLCHSRTSVSLSVSTTSYSCADPLHTSQTVDVIPTSLPECKSVCCLFQ